MAANSLTLSWVASTTGSPPITYQPQFRVTGASVFLPFGSPISGTTVVVTGLSPATNYDFDVIAINPAGQTTSAIATGKTLAATGVPPTAPTNLTVEGQAPPANPGTESVAGTKVTNTTSSINASPTPGTAGSGNVLTIGTDSKIYLNGTFLGGANVTTLYYDSNHTAWQLNASGNWFTPITAATTGSLSASVPSGYGSASLGPTVTGSLATVDFGAATGQIVPQTVWGIGTGGYINSWSSLSVNATFNNLARTISIPLLRLNASSGSANNQGYISGGVFVGNNIATPDWSYMTPFIKVMVSNGGFITPSTLLVVGATPNKAGGGLWSTSDYQSVVTQTINWIVANVPGVNLWGWEVSNEPDGGTASMTPAQCASYASAAKAGITASNQTSVKVIGPVTSYANGPYIQAVANTGVMDVCCYHMYVTGTSLSAAASMNLANTLPASPTSATPYSASAQARSNLLSSSASNKSTIPLMMGEWNLNNVPGLNTLQTTYVGSVYNAAAMINALNGDKLLYYGANWELYADSDYGLIQTSSSTTLIPGGYVFQVGSQRVFGTRFTETVVNATSTPLAVIGLSGSSSSGLAVMLVNYSNTAAIGPGTLGLSRWLVNSSGSGTVNVFTVNAANPTGSTTTTTVSAGLLTLTIPAATVLIIYV